MMLLKIQSLVLSEAVKDKSMPAFQSYFCGFCGFERTKDGCFISKAVTEDGIRYEPQIKLALMDYCFNEPEARKLWKIAERVLGKKFIDLNVVKEIEL